MYRTASNHAAVFLGALMVLAAPRAPLFAQAPARIVSSEIGISRDRAEIKVEFEDGRQAT